MDELLASSVMIFGQWRFDCRLGELCRQDGAAAWAPVAIGARAAAILAALLREPGTLVSKDALMDAAWPSTAVEANNLTVQIAALRRVLDEGRTGDSLIQTVAGRGYRFVGALAGPEPPASVSLLSPVDAGPSPSAAIRRPPRWVWAGVAIAFVTLLLLAGAWRGSGFGHMNLPARMSLAVMPFENLGGKPGEDYLADAITDDLTTLMQIMSLGPVVSVQAARTLKGRNLRADEAGRILGVRYLLRGSARRLGTTLRVNAQLVSTETAAALWTDRFDVSIADLGAGQEEAVTRIGKAIGMEMIAIEDARSRRERPDDPDALDLVLRARALELQLPSEQRLAEVRDLYERALQRDPSLEAARFGLVNMLLDDEDANPHGRKAVLERTRALLVRIRATQPASWQAMLTKLHWLSWQFDHCPETIELAQRFIAAYPVAIYPRASPADRWLGDCLTRMGRADEALPVLQRAIKHGATDGYQSHNERNIQYALLLLGRYDASVVWGKRALAANPEDLGWERARLEFRLAAADVLAGRIDDAKREIADGMRLRPTTTLREFASDQEASPEYAAQVARVIDGLRLAGLRDHAEEDADFGAPADALIHQRLFGPTPNAAPGATTIRTDDLVALLAQQKPVVIDTLVFSAGRSIPGAVGLRVVGEGGDLADIAQDHLRPVLHELTHGDLGAPVVAVGWNAESFDGRNVALRLAALGYTHVYWYRGGREAWEVRQLPEAELVPTDW